MLIQNPRVSKAPVQSTRIPLSSPDKRQPVKTTAKTKESNAIIQPSS